MAESLEQTRQLGLSFTSADGTTESDHDTPTPRASGFFILPYEIRQEIYKYAFRREILYLHERLGLDSSWSIHCVVHSIGGPCGTASFLSECRKQLGIDFPERLPIESLQVCQKFYAEASEVLWSTNTWHFEGAAVFSDVLARTDPHNRAAMKRLSLVVPWWDLCQRSRSRWAEVLRGPLIETLRGLKELKVVITYFSGPEELLESGYRRQVRWFGTFSKLRLETVEVSIQSWSDESGGQRTCTELAIIRYSQLIKRRILGDASEDAIKQLARGQRIERSRLDGQSRRIERRIRREKASQSLDIDLDLGLWIG